MAVFCSILIGYLLGNFNPSYLIARKKGFDIRKRGSGNAGASNAVITMGKAVGAFSALFDIFKAFVAVEFAAHLFPQLPQAGNLAGVACIFGHVFPILMGFRGGKGLAALGGVVLAFDLRIFFALLFAEVILALIVDYICIVPITASVLFPILYLLFTEDLQGAAIYGLATLLILYKHTENIRRIRGGTEAHLSFLWKRDEEIERLTEKEDRES